MRQLASLVCCLVLAVPAAAVAQLSTQSPPVSPAAPAPQASSPSPQQEATEPPAGDVEPSGSLFDPTWNQFFLGGRWSSVSGDPARWQRYQDLRDGVLFRDARFARENPDGI